MVASDMAWNTVLEKHIDNEKLGQVHRGTKKIYQNVDSLFREPVNNHEDGVRRCECRKRLYEVHEDWCPWIRQNEKLLEGTIELVKLRLRVHACSIRLDIVSHISTEPGQSNSL